MGNLLQRNGPGESNQDLSMAFIDARKAWSAVFAALIEDIRKSDGKVRFLRPKFISPRCFDESAVNEPYRFRFEPDWPSPDKIDVAASGLVLRSAEGRKSQTFSATVLSDDRKEKLHTLGRKEADELRDAISERLFSEFGAAREKFQSLEGKIEELTRKNFMRLNDAMYVARIGKSRVALKLEEGRDGDEYCITRVYKWKAYCLIPTGTGIKARFKLSEELAQKMVKELRLTTPPEKVLSSRW